jgi:TetR/AcrR family transcriptional repressor of nem operon
MSVATRDKLIRTALDQFAAHGYNATSVQAILQASGVNAGSLYYFFPTKQDLLIAVLDAYRDGIRPMLVDPAWAGVTDPIERVFALLGRYRFALETTDCLYGCPIGSLALELHEPDPAVRERLAANFKGWIDVIEECFVAAGDRLPRDVDRRALATLALATMEGGVMLSRTDRTLDAFDRSVGTFRTLIDQLLAKMAPAPNRQRKRLSEADR